MIVLSVQIQSTVKEVKLLVIVMQVIGVTSVLQHGEMQAKFVKLVTIVLQAPNFQFVAQKLFTMQVLAQLIKAIVKHAKLDIIV